MTLEDMVETARTVGLANSFGRQPVLVKSCVLPIIWQEWYKQGKVEFLLTWKQSIELAMALFSMFPWES